MKHSIKKQFAFIFIGLMVITLLGCYVINNVFLQDYYEGKRKGALLSTYEVMNTASKNGTLLEEDFQIDVTQLSERYNIMGVIQNSDTFLRITFGNDVEILQSLFWDRLYMPVKDLKIIEKTADYTLQKVIDSKTHTEYMEMVGNLVDGEIFYIRTPLENIRESVEIANRFLLYVGITGVVLSSIVIWFVIKKITAPILELADISKRMTKLDFEAKYTGHKKNEIALLGDNINQLSEALEETIRELKTANIELQQDIENKNRIDEMRKEFLSNVSHELKTPIALIQGYAEGLQEGIHDDDAESRAFYCDVIVDEAGKMNTMVKKLMTLSELEFGGETVRMERFDIAALLSNFIQSAQLLATQNGITVEMEPYGSMYVWADEFKIEEVVSNYFSNAVNHCAGEKKIRIGLEQKENRVRITVFNTGVPIPEESLPLIWGKFYKVDKARTRAYGGSGVGLSIVKAIMESLHQDYGVENRENGVCFWFELETVGKDE